MKQLLLDGVYSQNADEEYYVPSVQNHSKRHLRLGHSDSFCYRFLFPTLWQENNIARSSVYYKRITCRFCQSIIYRRPENIGSLDWLLILINAIRLYQDAPKMLPFVNEYRTLKFPDDLVPLGIMADWFDEQGDDRGEILRCTITLLLNEMRKPFDEGMSPKKYCLLVNTRERLASEFLQDHEPWQKTVTSLRAKYTTFQRKEKFRGKKND